MIVIIIILILIMIGLAIDGYQVRLKMDYQTMQLLQTIKDSRDDARMEIDHVRVNIRSCYEEHENGMKDLYRLLDGVAKYIDAASRAMESISGTTLCSKQMLSTVIADGERLIIKLSEMGEWVQKAILVDDRPSNPVYENEPRVICGFRPNKSNPIRCVDYKEGACVRKITPGIPACKFAIKRPICGLDELNGLCTSNLMPPCVHLTEAPEDPYLHIPPLGEKHCCFDNAVEPECGYWLKDGVCTLPSDLSPCTYLPPSGEVANKVSRCAAEECAQWRDGDICAINAVGKADICPFIGEEEPEPYPAIADACTYEKDKNGVYVETRPGVFEQNAADPYDGMP